MTGVERFVGAFGAVVSTWLAGAMCAEAEVPAWLELSGEARARYESLDGQFRAGGSGSDQLIALRTLVKAEADFDRFGLTLELHDARTYLDDAGTPLSTSFVNPLDVLQAYAELPVGEQSALRLGRFTLDIAGRRFAERNDFRNTINAFSGAYWRSAWDRTGTLEAFYTVPVRKRPFDRDDLDDNAFELDDHDTTRRFWGVHWQGPELGRGIRGDLFVYGLDERDRSGRETPDRELWEVGARLRRPPAAGAWDMDLEGSYRTGERRASADPADTSRLDVRAHLLHAELGYTFDAPWRPRLGIEYDVATGDDDPSDDEYGRYERLYGTRRRDLGNTSLHGPLTRSNISVPAVRVSFATPRFDGQAYFQWFSLDAARDTWIQADLRDPSGESGSFVGHTLEWRLRYWLQPQRLRLEVGGSALWFGEFAESVPGGPEADRTLYGYAQLTATF